MQKAVNLLRGFVRIGVECPYPERFINLCAVHHIAFWGADRIGELRLEATIPARCLPQAEAFAVKLGGSLTAIKQRGALFFLERFKRRYVLITGLLLCIAALFISNRYIWEFTVEGNKTVPSEAILEALREIGIKTGSPASAVDIVDIRNKVLMKLDGLSWITVNVSGSRAAVVVRERVAKPLIYPRNTPVNIVAAKPGLITRIDALAGAAQVFPGDTVRKGQLLVSGLIDSSQVGVRLVNARADVTARTWTELKAITPVGAVGKRYTGRETKRYALVFAGSRVNLYRNTGQPYAMCDKISKTQSLRVGGGFSFPVALVTETFTEYEPVAYQLDESVAESLLRRELSQTLRGGLAAGGEILTETVTFHPETGFVSATLTAECLERIDVPRKVEIGDVLARRGDS
ncbi:MAG: sporulation protein YqfD [Oscillospiraceae bacterium]|jgi:similar to stage IV sporulation protein|nr:sporulation protein YqfD [Oscillospiraceae bacterium]